LKEFGVITETAKAIVATMAKQSANLASLVAVIDLKLSRYFASLVDREFVGSADQAPTVLSQLHFPVLIQGNPIELLPVHLSDAGLANPQAPRPSVFCTTSVAMGSSILLWIARIIFGWSVPGKIFHRLHSFAFRAGLFCSGSAGRAVANATDFAHRVVVDWFALFAQHALLQRKVAEKISRIVLHCFVSNLSSAGARAGNSRRVLVSL